MIKAVFQEIAVVFVPQNYSSTHDDLQLRASQAAVRLGGPAFPSTTLRSKRMQHVIKSNFCKLGDSWLVLAQLAIQIKKLFV